MPKLSATIRTGTLLTWAGLMLAVLQVDSRAEEFPQARGGHGGRHPVYQRHATVQHPRRRPPFSHSRRSIPRTTAFSFQRPYPYHLDYYRMRYGGSYAPYFGNQYGVPAYVIAPPYYGDYLRPGYLPYGSAVPYGPANGEDAPPGQPPGASISAPLPSGEPPAERP